MMITKYRTGGFGNKLIEEIEVERETDASVWINGTRSSKSCSWLRYHHTWGEAKEYLLNKAQNELDGARIRLERAQGAYGNVKGLKQL
jgi:hypothetical protein